VSFYLPATCYALPVLFICWRLSHRIREISRWEEEKEKEKEGV
jgi:hypothetical protein